MLKQQIKSDVVEAMKTKDAIVCGVLRMALSSISAREKEKRYKIAKEKPQLSEDELVKESEFDDQEVMDAISSEIKKRRDAIALYEQGNRPELADQEKNEITILQKYLPEQLSIEELEKLVKESMANVGAKEMKDMGKVMADLMPKVKGRADNAQISKIIKGLL